MSAPGAAGIAGFVCDRCFRAAVAFRTFPGILLAALACMAPDVRAQDWTATMPPVGTVLQVVDQYVQTREFTGRYKGDPDFVASAQLGSLRSLRRIMVDVTGIKDLAKMPPTMRAQTEQYLWAELAVVLRIRARLATGTGWMTRSCRDPASNYRRAFPRESPDKCLLSLLHQNSGSYEASYGYHQEIWPELFPAATAARYVELTRAKARTTPVLDQVLRYTAEEPALPRAVAPPRYAQCADWRSYRYGAELCRLIAQGCTAASIPTYAQFRRQLQSVPSPAGDGAGLAQTAREALDSARRPKHGPSGVIYGPFRSSQQAVLETEPLVRRWTDEMASDVAGFAVFGFSEVVGWVIHRRGAPPDSEYYVTTLARSEFASGSGPGSYASASPADMALSMDKSFENSCEVPADFELVDAFHSHPNRLAVNAAAAVGLMDIDSFSAADLAMPSTLRQYTSTLGRFTGGLYLMRGDRCILYIAGSSKPRSPSDAVHIRSPDCPRL